jgi:hypothetical protein
MYNQTGTNQQFLSSAGVATTVQVTSPGLGKPATTLSAGIPAQNEPTWPVFSPGVFPARATGNQALPGGIGFFDPNAGRPARQMQWSIGIQREISRDLVVDASYVGNVGAWWQGGSPGGLSPLENINAITPAMLAARGLNINNSADQALLVSTLGSATAKQRGFSTPPYPGFSPFNTVAQSLRPFPQFGYIPAFGAPLGKTWYDALQMKVTKRFSHGLVFSSSFSWQKSLQLGIDTNPNVVIPPTNQQSGVIGNPELGKSLASLDQPYLFNLAATYTLPRLPGNYIVSWVLKDWQINSYLNYASGLPIPAPPATTSIANELFQPTTADRVPGVPLYTQDPNCRCYDPAKTFILNPKTWVNPPQGAFGTAALFYSDYRYQRHPIKNMGLGREFRFKERYGIEVRADFSNIFNRTYLNNPTATGFAAPQSVAKNGLNAGGFGYVNLALSPTTPYAQPRNGVIVVRVRF